MKLRKRTGDETKENFLSTRGPKPVFRTNGHEKTALLEFEIDAALVRKPSRAPGQLTIF